MKYIKKVDERQLYDDGSVELWNFSRANENEEAREEAVATVASVCYGKPAKDAKKLVKRLWTESKGLPSSAFEFVRRVEFKDDCDRQQESGIELSLRNFSDLMTDKLYCYTEEDKQGCLDRLRRSHQSLIATFRIRVPIFIARQVMRHRQFSYQELSRRYTTDERVPLEFWMPPLEEIKTGEELQADIIWLRNYFKHGLEIYDMLMEDGLLAEDARAVLPQAAYTQFWMQGNVPAWKNYFKLRTDSHAQKEHRELAAAMLKLLKEHQPELYEKVKP